MSGLATRGLDRHVELDDRRIVARVRIRLVNADAWEAVTALDALSGYERALLAELEREASR
jgi:hypothetical protein